MTPNGMLYQLPPVERHEEPLRAMPTPQHLEAEEAVVEVLARVVVLAVVGLALWVLW